MAFLFTETIHNWQDWSAVFQSKTAFLPLVPHICKKEHLPVPQTLGALTPGTNAVFRVSDYVLKIYAPAQSGIGTVQEVSNGVFFESNAMKSAAQQGVLVPMVIATGIIHDAYDFAYMIQDFVQGVSIKNMWPQMRASEKEAFALKLKQMVLRLQESRKVNLKKMDLLAQTLQNERWHALNVTLVQELHALAKKTLQENQNYVLCHGDLNEDNVLITPTGEIALLDFGDALLAPACYELPPVVFELFREDATAVKAYMGEQHEVDFLHALTQGLSFHDFGGDIIYQFFKRSNIDGAEIDSIAKLKHVLSAVLFTY